MSDGEAERVLDVREIEGEPFPEIDAALRSLDDGRLVLLSDFEPAPLYGVLDARGFEHESERDDGVWRVVIEPG